MMSDAEVTEWILKHWNDSWWDGMVCDQCLYRRESAPCKWCAQWPFIIRDLREKAESSTERDNVVKLVENKTVPGEVSQALVEWLEARLAEAKTGELQGMAGAQLHSDREASYYAMGFVGGFGVLGALDVVKLLLTLSTSNVDPEDG